ncbi:MAG: tetratricopeptide repeat protein [Planctomycetota bacterium]
MDPFLNIRCTYDVLKKINDYWGLIAPVVNAAADARRHLDHVLELKLWNDAINMTREFQRAIEPSGKWTHEDTNYLAAIYMERGNCEQSQKAHAKALESYQQCLCLREAVRREVEPVNAWTPELRRQLATAHTNFGNAAGDLGEFAKAIEHYEQAIYISQELRRQLEPVNAWTSENCEHLAVVYINRGNLYYNFENYDLAGENYDQSVAVAPSAWLAWATLGLRALDGVTVSWPAKAALAHALDLFFVSKDHHHLGHAADLCRSLIDHCVAPLGTQRLVDWLGRHYPNTLTGREDGRRLAKLRRDAAFGETILEKLAGLDDAAARAAVGVDRLTLEASVRLAFGDPMGARDLLEPVLGGDLPEDDRLPPAQWIGASLFLRAMDACLDEDFEENRDWALDEIRAELSDRDAAGVARLGRATLHAAARVLWMSDEDADREQALGLWAVATRDEPGMDYLAAYYWRYFAADALGRDAERAEAIDAVVRAERQRRDLPGRLSPLLRQPPKTLDLDNASPREWVRRVWDAAALHDAAEPIDRFLTDEEFVEPHPGLLELLATFDLVAEDSAGGKVAIRVGDEALTDGYARHLELVEGDAELTQALRAKNIAPEEAEKLRKELKDDLYALRFEVNDSAKAYTPEIGHKIYDWVKSARPVKEWARIEWVLVLLVAEGKIDEDDMVWLGHYVTAARDRMRRELKGRKAASMGMFGLSTTVSSLLPGVTLGVGAMFGVLTNMMISTYADWIHDQAAKLYAGTESFPSFDEFRKTLTERWREEGQAPKDLEMVLFSDSIERALGGEGLGREPSTQD